MMSKVTQLRNEADRLITTYMMYKDCNDPNIRRRVHIKLDHFLMENRETAAILLLLGLDAEIERQSRELQLDFEVPEPKPTLINRLVDLILRRHKSTSINKETLES